MADDLRADLGELLAELGERPVLNLPRQGQGQAAPYSRPESGVELKEMARNPTFGFGLPELRVLLPWLDGGRHGER